MATPNVAAARPFLALGCGEARVALVVESQLEWRQATTAGLAPELSLGFAPGWTISVSASERAWERWGVGGACAGECVSGWRRSTAEVKWAAISHRAWTVAPLLRVGMREGQAPYRWSVAPGLHGVWRPGAWQLETTPVLERGVTARASGNRTTVRVPVAAWHRAGPGWVGARVTYEAATAVWRDGYALAFGGLVHMPMGRYFVEAGLGFPALLGPQNTAVRRNGHVAFGVQW